MPLSSLYHRSSDPQPISSRHTLDSPHSSPRPSSQPVSSSKFDCPRPPPRSILRQPNHEIPPAPYFYESSPLNGNPRVTSSQAPPGAEAAHKRNSLPADFQSLTTNRDRHLSLPAGLLSPRVSEADMEKDRLARACGQTAMPLFYDQRRGPYIEGLASSSRPSSRFHEHIEEDPDSHMSSGQQLPYVPKLNPHKYYRKLDGLLRRDKHRAMDYLLYEDVLTLYKRDGAMREQCENEKQRPSQCDKDFSVIGAPLHQALLHSSSAVVVGEYRHDVPIVVIACIEELYRTGIYQNGLFRALPNRERHLQLMDIYDHSPDFGAKYSLRGQAMPDVCALLSTYLSNLPGPIIDPILYDGFWHWCVKPSVKRQEQREQAESEDDEEMNARRRRRPSHRRIYSRDVLLRSNVDDEVEVYQISIAQILLRFLPAGNLSLLLYLFGFFTQIPLCPDNGIHFEDISRIFAHRMIGGTSKANAQRMMVWLLSRWSKISEDLCGDGKSVVASPAIGTGHIGSSPQRQESGPCRVSKDGDDLPESSKLHRTRSHGVILEIISIEFQKNNGVGEERVVAPTAHSDGDLMQRTPSAKRSYSGRNNAQLRPGLPMENDRTGYYREQFHSDNSVGSDFSPDILCSINTTSITANVQELDQPDDQKRLIYSRIAELEKEFKRNNDVVADAIKQTYKAQDETRFLTERVGLMEKDMKERIVMVAEIQEALENDKSTLKSRIRNAEKERDRVLKMVDGIKGLLKVT
ncbi:hypothetical protein SERLA73DRAFT_71637 [Serpula lacrymans var. lacrymans S7.3]|uniref:Rho-GAP domain-containing protein n=1 Tax=Serpula lacrymans var. lacrymans (strain S7.3) TaxID=936435 RepID=F8PRR6_SERL3|nr:hypothetical protein SERLA73DRAFT_71637 [Serpula lacrymans var. lacrymans S7.3]